jgi:hypothetical protein
MWREQAYDNHTFTVLAGPMNPDPAPSPDPSPAPEPLPDGPPLGPENPPTLRTVISAQVIRENATAKARERLQRHQTQETRSFGGRRTRLVNDEAELARMVAMEERLLEMARRAIRKND